MNIYRQLDLDAQLQAEKETFGHLAPKKDVEYSSKVVFASSHYTSIGVVLVSSSFGGLPDSPWLFSALHELGDAAPQKTKKGGSIFEWHGTMKNYKFNGYYVQVLKY
jgi:hypothetical protein